MTALRHVSILLFMLLFFGCETPVDVDIPEHQPVLVLNGALDPAKGWEIHVSHSVDLFNNQQISPISNARVEVWENKEMINVLAHTPIELGERYDGASVAELNGFYKSDLMLPELGKTYTIEVSAPGYDEVSVEASVPARVEVVDESFMDSVAVDRFNFNAVIAEQNITIKDPPGEENYYMVRVGSVMQQVPVFFSINTSIQEAYLNDFGFSEEEVLLPLWDRIIFNDVFFEGETYELKVQLSSDAIFTGEDPLEEEIVVNEVLVELFTVSKSFYLSEITKRAQRESDGNPFVEAVPVYSNVENGLGAVGGVNVSFAKTVDIRSLSVN